MAALLLASIGSAAGLALGVGTMLTRDVLAALRWRFCERHSLFTSRAVVFLVMLAAALFTFGNLRSLVLEWNYLSMGLRGAGIILPFTLAVFCPGRISPALATCSIAAGTLAAILWKFGAPQGTDPLYAGLAASGLCLCGAYFRPRPQSGSCRDVRRPET